MSAPEGLASDRAVQRRTIGEARILGMLLFHGWVHELAAGEPAAQQATADARRTLDALCDLGLAHARDPRGERRFDPVEVLNHAKREGLAGRSRYWIDHFVPTARRLVLDLAAETNPAADGAPAVRRSVAFHRRFEPDGGRAGAKRRLRAPLPLELATVRDLRITPRSDLALTRRPARLEAAVDPSHPGAIDIAYVADFIAAEALSEPTAAPTPEAHALYLRAKDGLIVITDRVAALARALAPPSTPALTAIRSFWNYIIETMKCGAIAYEAVDANAPCDWALDHGWFDCRLGASLLIALCRAHGIAARLIGGHFLYAPGPANHYWAEAWIDGMGWAPFDLLCWDLSAGGADDAWRDRFFARLEPRMTTEQFPLAFTGPVGVSVPADWRMMQSARDGGVQIAMLHPGGDAIYVDHVRIIG